MSVYSSDKYTWDVMCNDPDCVDEKVFTTREQAIAAANRRTPGPATAAMLEKAGGLAGYLVAHNMRNYSSLIGAFIAEWEPGQGVKS